MKRIILFFAMILIGTTLAFAQKEARIQFKEITHSFGNVQESDGTVSCEFEFVNTGNAPLIIIRASASCGCTIPEYPQQPVAPGKKGIIKVTYNAKGRPGAFQKNVYVYSNTKPDKSILTIKGTVIPSVNKK
ncbi:DUF1573 domain-containing protein [Coprobacter tertius]|uniref:DUF1573 domain-containing protein n=1 Tax=Coprobacter tertius TaxID=2944915 RepID=A0ABT1MI57_9BACT|nr:DUF1573 domain-containing protein [Coprobacter tertius]MCP9611546.1 DUF1573 domain-containing protein [Coprobacter tertius]